MNDAPFDLPPDLARIAAAYEWRKGSGCSGARIFRLEKPGGANLYLKIAERDNAGLAAERAVLRWINDRLPAPAIKWYGHSELQSFLLTSEVSGVDAAQCSLLARPERLVRLLAEGLLRIHSVPIDDCPFDQKLPVKIEAARVRIEKRLVDETDFDPKRLGRGAQDLYSEVLRFRPTQEDLVFTHGDYCFPNVIIAHEAVSGFVDWGRAGIADRYQDLALRARSIATNLGPEWVTAFFEHYGLTIIDQRKLSFYELLDEFF